MPVYLLFCIVGDGLSKIVAMFTLAQETKGVVSDESHYVRQDFTARDAFTSCMEALCKSLG